MKFKATIFVEGVADMRFICDFVKKNIIHQNTRPVLKCIDDFVKCLDIIPARPFQTPNQKSKIYLYASLLTTNEEAKEKNRTYLNQEIWNLESVYLNPLFEFLQPHFINE